jgi:Ca-activated chloride channel family protein
VAEAAEGGGLTGPGALAEREGILHEVAARPNEPLFREDAARLARLRAHMGAEHGLGDPRARAMLLETAGRSHLR